jgi:hypothetical protein
VGPERQPHCLDGAQTALIAFGHCRFPPTVPAAMLPSSTASCGFKRSAPSNELLLSYFFFRSRPPLLLLMPCRRRLPHPTTGAPPESTTSPLPGWPSFCSFLREKVLRTVAATAIPRPPDTSHRQTSLVALPLRRRYPNDRPCLGHLPEP